MAIDGNGLNYRLFAYQAKIAFFAIKRVVSGLERENHEVWIIKMSTIVRYL